MKKANLSSRAKDNFIAEMVRSIPTGREKKIVPRAEILGIPELQIMTTGINGLSDLLEDMTSPISYTSINNQDLNFAKSDNWLNQESARDGVLIRRRPTPIRNTDGTTKELSATRKPFYSCRSRGLASPEDFLFDHREEYQGLSEKEENYVGKTQSEFKSGELSSNAPQGFHSRELLSGKQYKTCLETV